MHLPSAAASCSTSSRSKRLSSACFLAASTASTRSLTERACRTRLFWFSANVAWRLASAAKSSCTTCACAARLSFRRSRLTRASARATLCCCTSASASDWRRSASAAASAACCTSACFSLSFSRAAVRFSCRDSISPLRLRKLASRCERPPPDSEPPGARNSPESVTMRRR